METNMSLKDAIYSFLNATCCHFMCYLALYIIYIKINISSEFLSWNCSGFTITKFLKNNDKS